MYSRITSSMLKMSVGIRNPCGFNNRLARSRESSELTRTTTAPGPGGAQPLRTQPAAPTFPTGRPTKSPVPDLFSGLKILNHPRTAQPGPGRAPGVSTPRATTVRRFPRGPHKVETNFIIGQLIYFKSIFWGLLTGSHGLTYKQTYSA